MKGAPLPIATAEPEDVADAGVEAAAELATGAELVAGVAAGALVAAALVVAGAGVELVAALDAVFFDEQAAISVAPTATNAAICVIRRREPRVLELNIFRLLR